MIYIKQLSYPLHEEFLTTELEPFFRKKFIDLQYASKLQKNTPNLVDKLDFMEYVCLPGPLCERMFKIAVEGSKKNDMTCEQFVNVMKRVFGILEDQKKLAFSLFDFDDDGYITRTDVKLVLGCCQIPKIFDRTYTTLCSEAQ